ncbi:MAG: long-chain fatty acid--CoA ligase [Deltaproteobacteria bacterium]|nr:long-chain fatty acid--CoA ligase [Deltaproteobacteria bacterium]
MLKFKERSVAELFFDKVREKGDRLFLARKVKGNWEYLSYTEVEYRVRNLGLALISMGVNPQDRVAIFSPNRPEWVISDLASLSIGAIDVPIYATNSAKECEYILSHSESKIIFVSDQELFDKIASVKKNLPLLRKIITFERVASSDSDVMSIEEAYKTGESYKAKEEFDERMAKIALEDTATIIYTSGTTGPPKGVMLTHKNFLSNVYQAIESHPGIFEEGDRSVSFLPLSHSLERTAGYYLLMRAGTTIHYAESIQTVVDNMKEIKPHFVVSVPRLFEKIYAGIIEKVEKAPPLKKRLFYWATSVGDKAVDYIVKGKPIPLTLMPQYLIAKRLVLDKLKAAIGCENIKVFVSGGAPLSPEINRFFHSIGVTVHEGFGLTETTPITNVNTFSDFMFGTVGKPVADTEIKIAEDGEILIRGPQVMKGYYKNEEATREVFTEDGFFKTGDIGVILDGFLKITDRKKNIIITAGGKNITPANIEFAMLSSRFISQAMVIKLYEKIIEDTNQQFAQVERIKRFTLLPEEFSQATGELTPTLKLKRKEVLNKYGDIIESMYK